MASSPPGVFQRALSTGLSVHHPTGNLNNTVGGRISNTKCLAKDGNDDLSTFDKLLLSQGSVRIHIYLGKYIPAKTNPSTVMSGQKKLCINLEPNIFLAFRNIVWRYRRDSRKKLQDQEKT